MFRWPGADGTVREAKPAWNALTSGLTLIGHYRYAGDVTSTLGVPDDVYALAFVNDEGNTALTVWDGRDQPDITASGTAAGGPDTTIDVTIPLPPDTVSVSVYDMYGNRTYEGDSMGTLNIRLSPAVQYVVLNRAGITE